VVNVGILVHCRHLDTERWEQLVFGEPASDLLGDHAMLARVVLGLTPEERLACVVFGRGPSWREGMSEDAYAKKFLLDNLGRLSEFASLLPLIERAGPNGWDGFCRAMQAVVGTREVRNTVDEIHAASTVFSDHAVEKVIHIASASHAPRCAKEAAFARSNGRIDRRQMWLTLATDVSYQNTTPADVCVIEPLHRRDQPVTFVRPGLSEVIAPYFALSDHDKVAFIRHVEAFMQHIASAL